jgi:hypothetical protein
LFISNDIQTKLASERVGDWPTARAEATASNEKTLSFKWFDRHLLGMGYIHNQRSGMI